MICPNQTVHNKNQMENGLREAAAQIQCQLYSHSQCNRCVVRLSQCNRCVITSTYPFIWYYCDCVLICCCCFFFKMWMTQKSRQCFRFTRPMNKYPFELKSRMEKWLKLKIDIEPMATLHHTIEWIYSLHCDPW